MTEEWQKKKEKIEETFWLSTSSEDKELTQEKIVCRGRGGGGGGGGEGSYIGLSGWVFLSVECKQCIHYTMAMGPAIAGHNQKVTIKNKR